MWRALVENALWVTSPRIDGLPSALGQEGVSVMCFCIYWSNTMAAIYTKHKSSLRPCCHFVARTHSAQLHDMETSMDAAARLLSAGLSFGVAVLVVAEQRLMASDRRGMITRASLAARAYRKIPLTMSRFPKHTYSNPWSVFAKRKHDASLLSAFPTRSLVPRAQRSYLVENTP